MLHFDLITGTEVTMEFKRNFHLKREREETFKMLFWKQLNGRPPVWGLSHPLIWSEARETEQEEENHSKALWLGVSRLSTVHQHELMMCLRNQGSEQVLQKSFVKVNSKFLQESPGIHPSFLFTFCKRVYWWDCSGIKKKKGGGGAKPQANTRVVPKKQILCSS